LILLGYGLGAVSKPLFALAASPGLVLGARFIDRVGKGLRGAPRDALVADVTPLAIRGRAYGLRQALDTAGSLLGPLAALWLMALFASDFKAVFWVAAVPGWIAVLLVIFGVEGRDRATHPAKDRVPVRLSDLRALDRSFWGVVGIGVIFTMARFSEAFLILKAHAEGLSLPLAPLVLVAMNLVYSLGAYPAGALADRWGPHRPLVAGLGCLIAADACLAFGSGLAAVFAGIALWGAHMALTQGLLAQLVAERAPEAMRGSAFGAFNLATGLTMLAASVLAGLLWDQLGPEATFAAGGAFALSAAFLLVLRRRHWAATAAS
jgi:MFS family permease